MEAQYIYIFNPSEDVWPFINSISNKKEHKSEIEWCADVAERDVISISNEINPIFICPKKINKLYIKYIEDLFETKEIKTLTPNIHSGEICKDIINDKEIFKKITKFKKIKLVSYSASSQFTKLVLALRRNGIQVETPEAPDLINLWTVNHYGSKSGIRKTLSPSLMSGGLICKSIEEAILIAKNKYINNSLGVVIKTDKGHGGDGIKIVKKGDIEKSNKSLHDYFSKLFNKNLYWSKFSIVVEDLLDISNGTPSIEYKIVNNKIIFLYYCSMRVDKKGFYKGQEVNKKCISKHFVTEIKKIGNLLAKEYLKSGYKGYFDVDFIISKDNKIFVTESNLRRTGGTHVYKAAEKLIGKDFMEKTYILSNNDYLLPTHKFDFKKIKKLLSPILFNKQTKEGIVISSYNSFKQNMFAYIIFGDNKKRALSIENKMGVLLNK